MPDETTSSTEADETYQRRWWTLGVLSLSLVIIVAAVSSLNVTLPSLVRELDASSTELQWVVDAYALVFGGLLLFFGALGDRFGRKGTLQVGLGVFGLATLAATMADSPGQLVVTRALMGAGAALIMPATLSIITAIFPPEERARAIAVWVGFVGVGGAIGPVVSGVLLNHFWWGSVFFINVPLVVGALVASVVLVPASRDDERRRLDPVGGALSVLALGTVLFAIIEGPELGWTDPLVVAAFVTGALAAGSFVAWERTVRQPMLVLGWFRLPRFTVSALVITLMFFAMFGFLFTLTQYLQFARGWSPLTAGAAMLPLAITMLFTSPRGARLSGRIGPKATIIAGIAVAGSGMVIMSRLSLSSPYPLVALGLVALGAGMGLAGPAATTGIMSSLPLGKAGVGSAVNDTTREAGGAVGIAVLGTLLHTSYRSGLDPHLDGLPATDAATAREGVGGALEVAANLPDELGLPLADAARGAFMDGLTFTLTVAAVMFALAAVVVYRFFPATEAGVGSPEGDTVRPEGTGPNGDGEREGHGPEVEPGESLPGAEPLPA